MKNKMYQFFIGIIATIIAGYFIFDDNLNDNILSAFGDDDEKAFINYKKMTNKSEKDSITQIAKLWQAKQDSIQKMKEAKQDSIQKMKDSMETEMKKAGLNCLIREVIKSNNNPCQSTLVYDKIGCHGNNWTIRSTACPSFSRIIPGMMIGTSNPKNWAGSLVDYVCSVNVRSIYKAQGFCE